MSFCVFISFLSFLVFDQRPVRQELATLRRDVSARMAMEAFGNHSEGRTGRRPIAVLLGGGIAAGKTSLMGALQRLPE